MGCAGAASDGPYSARTAPQTGRKQRIDSRGRRIGATAVCRVRLRTGQGRVVRRRRRLLPVPRLPARLVRRRRPRAAVAGTGARAAQGELIHLGFIHLRSTIGNEFGGGRGIRTPDTLSGTAVFKTAAINRSAIPPRTAYSV